MQLHSKLFIYLVTATLVLTGCTPRPSLPEDVKQELLKKKIRYENQADTDIKEGKCPYVTAYTTKGGETEVRLMYPKNYPKTHARFCIDKYKDSEYMDRDNFITKIRGAMHKPAKIYIIDIPFDNDLEYALDAFTGIVNTRGIGKRSHECKIHVKRIGSFQDFKFVYDGPQPQCAPPPKDLRGALAETFGRYFDMFDGIFYEPSFFGPSVLYFNKEEYELWSIVLKNRDKFAKLLQKHGYVVVDDPKKADYVIVRDVLNATVSGIGTKNFMPPLSLRINMRADAAHIRLSTLYCLDGGVYLAAFFPYGGLLQIGGFAAGFALSYLLGSNVDYFKGLRRDYLVLDVKNNRVIMDIVVSKEKLEKRHEAYVQEAVDDCDAVFLTFMDYVAQQ